MKHASNLMPPDLAGSALRWDLPTLASGSHTVHSARQIEQAEQQARQDGFERGHAEGYAAGLREVREQAQRLAQLLDHLAAPLRQVDEQVERELLALTVSVAQRLLGEELTLAPEKVAHTVREALAALSAPSRELRIHLHPQDAQLLRGQLQLDTEAAWKLVPDATLARGDCRIDAENARVDARLDTRAMSLLRSLSAGDA